MQQSHSGLSRPFEEWDRLAVIIDKSKKPFQAKFYQLVPGALEISAKTEAAPFKARCFACHANGPRAIRFDGASAQRSMGWLDRLTVGLWNLRIKTYGAVDSVPGRDVRGGAAFRSSYSILSQPLGLKSCTRCHSAGEGIRRPLLLEHAGTANFLVQNGFMPPFPFRASADDLALLRQVLSRSGPRHSKN